MSTREQLFEELKVARDELWAALDRLDDVIEIYPGWKKREFLTHIPGWDAMVFDVLRRHLAGQEPADYGYTDIDSANARFVAMRQRFTLADARLECELNRFALVTLLEQFEDFDVVIQLPWGKETIAQFISGAIDHERTHMTDIINLSV
jgi:hypothetical protein